MEPNHVTEAFKELQKVREHLHQLSLHQWKTEVVFTWEWWVFVVLTIAPLILWWNIVDKKRAYEIAFYGCMLNIMSLVLDNIGTDSLWWSYPIKLIPVAPPLFTADSILVPIVFMIVYQLFSSSWRLLVVANLILAGMVAFIAEPIFNWIGYYQLNEWRYLYSFLFYLFSSGLARLVVIKIVK